MPSREEIFRTPNLAEFEANQKFKDDEIAVAEVPTKFSKIAKDGDLLVALDGNQFPERRYTRANRKTGKGPNYGKNHFQSIQRVHNGKYIILSGADKTAPASHLFVVKMESRRAHGVWGSNIYGGLPNKDRVVKVVTLDKKFWHGGGMSIWGDILAIALQSDNNSKILFLNISNPENPACLGEIPRPDQPNAGAAALAKLDSGHFVCAVWREVKNRRPRGVIDFYMSNEMSIRSEFDRKAVWSYPELTAGAENDPSYQSINFIKPKDENLDADEDGTRLYLVGTENESNAAPDFPGPDVADLFVVDVFHKTEDNRMKKPRIKRVASRRFFCNEGFCNFDAAAGIFVDPTESLYLYGAYHHRFYDLIRFAEFKSHPDRLVTKINDAWIELFEDREFRGKRLNIVGNRDSDSRFPDYNAIQVQGIGFDNALSSARFQLPRGSKYRLFKEKNFVGNRPNIDFVDLDGTGEVVEIPRFGDAPFKFDERVSSSRYV